VAITRDGWGDVWAFEDAETARYHPLIQDADLVVCSATDVARFWNYLFIGRLFDEVLGDRTRGDAARAEMQSDTMRDERHARLCEQGWRMLEARAKAPPVQPARICEMVVTDRRQRDEWHRREATRRTTMTETTKTTATPAAATTAKAPVAAPAPKTTHGKFALTAKITMGKNAEGKPYGRDNNPKRAGSASADAFALYKDGMTVEQLAKAGVSPADLAWNVEKGFVKVG